jgi:hypothetical protein
LGVERANILGDPQAAPAAVTLAAQACTGQAADRGITGLPAQLGAFRDRFIRDSGASLDEGSEDQR